MREKRTIVLVDDHPIFRLGLRFLLEQGRDYEVVGEAEDQRTAIDELKKSRAQICLMDLMLDSGSGLELLRRVQDELPQTRVLVVSMLDEEFYAERCVRAGAAGYLQKSEAPRDLLAALDVVVSGEVYLGRAATQRLMRRVAGGMPASANPLQQLTDREVEVLQLIGEGRRTSEIARLLHLSPKTIESHQAKLRRKLGARNGADLLRIAVSWREHAGRLRAVGDAH